MLNLILQTINKYQVGTISYRNNKTGEIIQEFPLTTKNELVQSEEFLKLLKNFISNCLSTDVKSLLSFCDDLKKN